MEIISPQKFHIIMCVYFAVSSNKIKMESSESLSSNNLHKATKRFRSTCFPSGGVRSKANSAVRKFIYLLLFLIYGILYTSVGSVYFALMLRRIRAESKHEGSEK